MKVENGDLDRIGFFLILACLLLTTLASIIFNFNESFGGVWSAVLMTSIFYTNLQNAKLKNELTAKKKDQK